MHLSNEQIKRYSRQILLPQIGEEGQIKILSAKVCIIGAGGLGSALGYYLSAAGVGKICIVDNDIVELSNLQRQISHNTHRLGELKVLSAKKTFEALNPDINVIPEKVRLCKDNILTLFENYDIICDCSDNFETRFLINDSCIILNKPLITGAVSQFEGQLAVIIPGESPCYRCLFESPPPLEFQASMQELGVIGFLPGVIGSLQAGEVIKLITGAGEILKGELLIYNALKQSFKKLKIPKNPNCTACGNKK
ncbi:MAG: molybdopterin-synthase adenylyltransferase MoeB [Nitrospirae bacterium]|jgi:adenylyltransferase/sulfurtransferase|nr:molybdopterin-synthase adenylyltransferase MoeB [Nitrospirota bacterium]